MEDFESRPHKDTGMYREEKGEKEEVGQRNVPYEIAHRVVVSVKKKAGKCENATECWTKNRSTAGIAYKSKMKERRKRKFGKNRSFCNGRE